MHGMTLILTLFWVLSPLVGCRAAVGTLLFFAETETCILLLSSFLDVLHTISNIHLWYVRSILECPPA